MNELEVLINLRGRIRRRNGLSKDGSEERTLTLNQLDALDFALNRIEKLDRLEKWVDKKEIEIKQRRKQDRIDFESGKDIHVDLVRYDKDWGKEELLKEVREVVNM